MTLSLYCGVVKFTLFAFAVFSLNRLDCFHSCCGDLCVFGRAVVSCTSVPSFLLSSSVGIVSSVSSSNSNSIDRSGRSDLFAICVTTPFRLFGLFCLGDSNELCICTSNHVC